MFFSCSESPPTLSQLSAESRSARSLKALTTFKLSQAQSSVPNQHQALKEIGHAQHAVYQHKETEGDEQQTADQSYGKWIGVEKTDFSAKSLTGIARHEHWNGKAQGVGGEQEQTAHHLTLGGNQSQDSGEDGPYTGNPDQTQGHPQNKPGPATFAIRLKSIKEIELFKEIDIQEHQNAKGNDQHRRPLFHRGHDTGHHTAEDGGNYSHGNEGRAQSQDNEQWPMPVIVAGAGDNDGYHRQHARGGNTCQAGQQGHEHGSQGQFKGCHGSRTGSGVDEPQNIVGILYPRSQAADLLAGSISQNQGGQSADAVLIKDIPVRIHRGLHIAQINPVCNVTGQVLENLVLHPAGTTIRINEKDELMTGSTRLKVLAAAAAGAILLGQSLGNDFCLNRGLALFCLIALIRRTADQQQGG